MAPPARVARHPAPEPAGTARARASVRASSSRSAAGRPVRALTTSGGYSASARARVPATRRSRRGTPRRRGHRARARARASASAPSVPRPDEDRLVRDQRGLARPDLDEQHLRAAPSRRLRAGRSAGSSRRRDSPKGPRGPSRAPRRIGPGVAAITWLQPRSSAASRSSGQPGRRRNDGKNGVPALRCTPIVPAFRVRQDGLGALLADDPPPRGRR